MPYKDKEYKKAYNKEWHINNNKTAKGRKSNLIGKWKSRGVIETEQYTFDELYEAYLYCSECEECGVTLTTGKRCSTSKCLDHDHTTGIFRNILCHCCNSKRR